MHYIPLKNSDLLVSRIALGGCPMGGYGWGQTNEKDFIDAIHTALDQGITLFDTADTYGLGESERVLAKGLGNHRHEVAIESKFGVRFSKEGTVYDNSPAYIREALEGSLRRLNTDYIDIYVIHYRDYSTPIEEVVDTLEALRKEGKVRYFGLSNVTKESAAELLPYRGKFVCCQDEFSLVCRKHEEDLLYLERELDVTPMTWGSLGQGILSGKYDRNCSFGADDRRSRDVYVNFHGEKLEENLRIVDELRVSAANQGISVPAAAIRWILDTLKDSVVLVGAKRPSQVLSNCEAVR